MNRHTWVACTLLAGLAIACGPETDTTAPNNQALKLEIEAISEIEIPADPPPVSDEVAQLKPNLTSMYHLCKDVTGQCLAAQERAVKVCESGQLELCRASRIFANGLCGSAKTCVDILDKMLAE